MKQQKCVEIILKSLNCQENHSSYVEAYITSIDKQTCSSEI